MSVLLGIELRDSWIFTLIAQVVMFHVWNPWKVLITPSEKRAYRCGHSTLERRDFIV
jgi:hypothetical protein